MASACRSLQSHGYLDRNSTPLTFYKNAKASSCIDHTFMDDGTWRSTVLGFDLVVNGISDRALLAATFKANNLAVIIPRVDMHLLEKQRGAFSAPIATNVSALCLNGCQLAKH